MARPISSVHVDIARLVWEVSKVSALSEESTESLEKLGKWMKLLVECLATRNPDLHPYGAHLLAEVDEYRIAEKERKKGKHSALSALSTESLESTPRTDRTDRADHKEDSLLGLDPSGKGFEPPKAPRARNVHWDALVEAFKLNPVSKNEKSLLGQLSGTLKAKGAAPEEVLVRMARYRAKYREASLTPSALVKHWDLLVPEPRPIERNRL